MMFFKKIRENYFFRDLSIVVLSVVIAAILIKTGILHNFIASTQGVKLIGSFIAGLFFTSIFTVAPATVALGEIARANSLLWVVLLGGFGAVFGDLVIFRFVKNTLNHDFSILLKHSAPQRLLAVFKMKYFRWFFAFLGALVIASPLPDELGLAMMGLTKVKMAIFIPLSFALNSFGILIVCLIARAL